MKSLSEQLGQPKVDKIPDWIINKTISLRTSLSEMVDNANAVLRNPSQPILHTNMKDINDFVKTAGKQEVLVRSMLASVEQLSK